MGPQLGCIVADSCELQRLPRSDPLCHLHRCHEQVRKPERDMGETLIRVVRYDTRGKTRFGGRLSASLPAMMLSVSGLLSANYGTSGASFSRREGDLQKLTPNLIMPRLRGLPQS